MLYKALKFAEKAHAGQTRKYSTRPYVLHPIEVMTKLQEESYVDDILVAALLHDTIEDCGVSKETLEKEFSLKVANLVMELTEPDDLDPNLKKLSRAERHQLLLDKLKNVSKAAKSIKLADRLCNLIDSDISNPECAQFFRKKYLKESLNIYEILKDADIRLARQLKEVIDDLATKLVVSL